MKSRAFIGTESYSSQLPSGPSRAASKVAAAGELAGVAAAAGVVIAGSLAAIDVQPTVSRVASLLAAARATRVPLTRTFSERQQSMTCCVPPTLTARVWMSCGAACAASVLDNVVQNSVVPRRVGALGQRIRKSGSTTF